MAPEERFARWRELPKGLRRTERRGRLSSRFYFQREAARVQVAQAEKLKLPEVVGFDY